MPHTVFEGAPPLDEFWRTFEPFKEVRADGTVLEARASYLRHDGDMVLIESLALELGPAQHFYVLCDRRGERVTIRCEQFSPVARTAGVIEVVTRIARQFRDMGAIVRSTNLDL